MTEPVFQSYAQMMRETDYARFAQEHRAGGTLEINIFRADQGPVDMVDPPNAELAFTAILGAGGSIENDFNDGWQSAPQQAERFILQPAGRSCAVRTDHAHSILVAEIDAGRLSVLLGEAGLRGDPFGPLYRFSDAPLPQVAYACGFASQSHFGQVFRRATGASPGAYRAEVAG